jgi:hypothetical protein
VNAPLTEMASRSLATLINEANSEAVSRMVSTRPRLIDVIRLGDFSSEIQGKCLTHSGPPIEWSRMSGAQRGAVIAAILFERWAPSAEKATVLAAGGGIRFVTNHEVDGVGPMAGVLSPGMHVYVVEDAANKTRCYSSTEYDCLFGAFDAEAIQELRHWNKIVYPSLGRAVRLMGGLDLKPLMARALIMGDELHSRQSAASALLATGMAPALVEACGRSAAAATLRELARNDLTFLPLAMAACKIGSMAASGIRYSTIVTAMSRNGTDFGIQVSGLDHEWSVAPAPTIEGIYFPGYGTADAGLDVGDSAITETNGLGAFALPAAPAIAGLIGTDVSDLDTYAREMTLITAGINSSWSIPQLGSGGTPIGIDIRKVLQTGIMPIIDTAIAHREPGHRIIGAGTTRAPLSCFRTALDRWFVRYATDLAATAP